MNAEEFAAMLNGREYGNEITKAEKTQAKESGLIVAYGYSDDNLELRGMIDDEIGAYDGTEIRIRMDKMDVVRDGACKDCLARTEVFGIKAEFAPSDLNASWRITSSVPFEPFDIMEDGELFCRGAVIDVKAIQKGQ